MKLQLSLKEKLVVKQTRGRNDYEGRKTVPDRCNSMQQGRRMRDYVRLGSWYFKTAKGKGLKNISREGS